MSFGKLSLLRPWNSPSLARARGEEGTGRDWEESALLTGRGGGLERGEGAWRLVRLVTVLVEKS